MAVEASVVIRTLNEAKHVGDLLKGIQEQNYTDWEIILVDSGSTDGTVDIARQNGANIYHIPRDEFTFGRSLNLGCAKANGSYLVFASGHVQPTNNNWLRNLIEPFAEPSVAMVYGRQRGTDSNRLSEVRDLQMNYGATSSILVNQPNGNNGNAAVRKDLWLRNPFDESLPGLEDVDWARRIQKEGYRVYYAADAAVYHVHEETLRQVYRRFLREAIAFKRIFPNRRFTRSDLLKSLSYSIVRDLLYAFRHRKPSKVFSIPSTRLAEFLGTYNGMSYHKTLLRGTVKDTVTPSTSRSVVIDGPGRHSLRVTPVPRLSHDEALIQVGYVGVCATDVEVANGRLEYYEQGMAHFPIVPGHEYSGVLVDTGPAAGRLKKGQKVVGECAVGCGRCSACDVGEYYRCPRRQEVGVINKNGAYAHYLSIPAKYVHMLPSDVPLKYGALVEPTAVCLKGLRKLTLEPGRNVCVVGAGSLGNLCAQLLLNQGLKVTSLDRDPRRLKLLEKYDVDTLTELLSFDKYDYVIEASGNEQVLPQIIATSKPSSQILLLGLPYTTPVSTSFSTVTGYDKTVFGSVASHSQDWRKAIRLIHTGAVNLEDHTDVVEPLDSYKQAWESMETRKHFKVLLRVNDGLASL